MTILLKSLSFIDSKGIHKPDDYIFDGESLIKTAPNLSVKIDQTLDCTGLFGSAGWVDLRCMACEPGEEYKESLDSLGDLLQASGFSKAVLMPNTHPAIQNKSDLQFLKNKTYGWFTEAVIQTSITKENKGEDFTDILDLNAQGAFVFGDGLHPLSNPDRLAKVLQYLQKFDGILFDHSYEPLLALFGQMHEGLISTRIGMKGIPSLAEEIAVKKNLDILKYTGGRMHFQTISTKGAVEAIRLAKGEGLDVTCDTSIYHLLFSDEDLLTFDANFKVMPPFRDKENITALVAGLKDGTIDALVSNHQPQDFDAKHMEFDLAQPGMIGLQTFLPAMIKLSDEFGWELLISKITDGPRRVLGEDLSSINSLTIFDPSEDWHYNHKSNLSLSSNHPWMDSTLQGKVKFVIKKNKLNKL
ncbi:dihydroorotase [Belliella buryatensis]|uniref:Dihydroorotase n=1 Tax=Belliella buryatensis TaxID=1500549 RepID=A0A239GF31_9BACT|nr:dihydroorotase [Belliella buryatensis]SNS67083.1 dihydroorotase [Belliella buryatensis]